MERPTDETLEADEFICRACGRISREHDRDGLRECHDCVQAAER